MARYSLWKTTRREYRGLASVEFPVFATIVSKIPSIDNANRYGYNAERQGASRARAKTAPMDSLYIDGYAPGVLRPETIALFVVVDYFATKL